MTKNHKIGMNSLFDVMIYRWPSLDLGKDVSVRFRVRHQQSFDQTLDRMCHLKVKCNDYVIASNNTW